jgi:galactarate dehydratase
MEPLEGYTFEGYRNPDGSVGTRNILAITTTVQCVSGVVEFAVKRIKDELLPKYPNVDDVVSLEHTYGCGVAIEAPGAEIPIRTLRNIARTRTSAARPCWSAWAAKSCSRRACSRKGSIPILIGDVAGPARLPAGCAHVGFGR